MGQAQTKAETLKLTPEQVAEIERNVCRASFREFIEAVRPEYVFNWHHLVLIDALQRLAERRFDRLVVMMPPRHGKSELVSRLFPAWRFAANQNEQIILSSYALDLAAAMNRDCQRIITSDEYKRIFPGTRLRERNEEAAVRNNHRFDIVGHKGYLISAGVGGGITGAGATVGIIDDPVKNAQEADSQTYRDSAWEWYTTTFRTRFEPGAIEVICQTRWHEDDLTGRILQRKEGDKRVEVISLPALAESDEQTREMGSPLWPGKYSRASLLQIKSDIGSRAWNALYQQRPAPDEGAILKKVWFHTYDPRTFTPKGRVNFYLDTAYTDKEANDPTAAIAYIKIGADFYVLECVSKWIDFNDQIKFVESFCMANGYNANSIIRVEPKATGKSLVQVLKKQTGLNIREADPPKESKTARANSVAPIVEAGRVFLPAGMVWVDDFLTEIASFPNAAHDDRVDCLTGMIISETQSARFGLRL